MQIILIIRGRCPCFREHFFSLFFFLNCFYLFLFFIIFVSENIFSLEDIMEGDLIAIVQPLELIAHVLEQQPVLGGLHFESTFQQPQDKLGLMN